MTEESLLSLQANVVLRAVAVIVVLVFVTVWSIGRTSSSSFLAVQCLMVLVEKHREFFEKEKRKNRKAEKEAINQKFLTTFVVP